MPKRKVEIGIMILFFVALTVVISRILDADNFTLVENRAVSIILIVSYFIMTYAYYRIRNSRFNNKVIKMIRDGNNRDALAYVDKAIRNRPKMKGLTGLRCLILGVSGQYIDFVTSLKNAKSIEGTVGHDTYLQFVEEGYDYLLKKLERGINFMHQKPYIIELDELNIMYATYFNSQTERAKSYANRLTESKLQFCKCLAFCFLADSSLKENNLQEAEKYKELAYTSSPSEQMKCLIDGFFTGKPAVK